MKRMFTMIAIALMALSCEVVERDMTPLGHSELTKYAGELYANSVVLPVKLAEFAISLDEYLTMPDEQKQENAGFYGKVRQISADVYQFEDNYVSCTIDTEGNSVWDEGAEWKYLSFKSKANVSGGYGDMYSSGAWSTWITDDVYLTFNADTMGEAMLMVQVEMPGGTAMMALKSRQENEWNWNISVEGQDSGSNGLRSEYTTGYDTGGINMTTLVEEYKDIYERDQRNFRCLATGVFSVDIYQGDRRIDWVEMTITPEKGAEYQASR